ncbi:GntR family transcriptional regulator [Lactobacillus sp. HT06-2]|uniref:GntR family transcriptional regulator n=1 Tax=Lactobacillus sp. HT06-2 TaxID=2080222 RepID=UPI000CD9F7E0|nr:GntR family transcriptional regulator [Lactobacillus sp. HT06-2]
MSNEDKAYRYLKQQIINGKYQPGHVLSENQMCIKLNMSRTPVREAFKKLENDGLLERDGQETRVTQVTLAELKENYDLRSMLEVYALKKSFANLDQTRLNDFRLKFEKALNDKDWTSYLELDAQFHQYLTHSNDKSVLQKNLDLLKSQTNRMRYAIRDDQRCMISSVDELLQIIAAIKENNQAKAVAQLNKHVKSVYDWERIYLEQ